MATSRSSRESRARYTSPIPPAPSWSRTSYGPMRSPVLRDMEGRSYRNALAIPRQFRLTAHEIGVPTQIMWMPSCGQLMLPGHRGGVCR